MNPNEKSLRGSWRPPAGRPRPGTSPRPSGSRPGWRRLRSTRPPRRAPSFARLSLRVAGIACLFAVAAVGVNFSAITNAFDDERRVAGGDDPVAEVVNLGS
jgi:hypothetical protein